MALKPKTILFYLVVLVILNGSATADASTEAFRRPIRTAPHRSLQDSVIDGAGVVESDAHGLRNAFDGIDRNKVVSSRVSISTVAWFTLAMAAATGLGAVPFFFVELEPQWAGVCNGMAAGVMLAASFDLVEEGKSYGGGNWVVFGILAGGIFIWLCKKFLEQFGDISMLDIKGADAQKVVLVIGIMTLHSFGEGSGVGVSFAGSKGLSQGLLVTLAIAVHNIPEGLAVSMVLSSKGISPQNAMIWSVITSLPQPLVAVPSFICADAFHKFLPFCTGFAAGCMIWMVVAEVLPDAFKEASSGHVASAATAAVAFMETLGLVLEFFGDGNSKQDTSGFLLSLLFGLGPLFGGVILVSFALAFQFQQPLLTGLSSGIALVLALWRPLQLVSSFKMGLLFTLLLLALSSSIFFSATTSICKLASRKKTSASNLTSSPVAITIVSLQAFLACGSIALHALAEGLALGVAAPKAYGLGRHMILPVSLHGLPRGAAVASCIYGATDSWRLALAVATFTGFAGPISAISAILAGIDYTGLDVWMVIACGSLIPCFGSILRRSLKLDARRSLYGLVVGLLFASGCLMSTRLVCLHTPYGNSAPEAVT